MINIKFMCKKSIVGICSQQKKKEQKQIEEEKEKKINKQLSKILHKILQTAIPENVLGTKKVFKFIKFS